MLGRFDYFATSSARCPARVLPLAAGAAVALGALATPALAQTWIGAATGNWDAGTNWQGGVSPVSDPTTALVFSSGNAAAITATNNLGSPFLVNSLAFNVNNAFSVNGTATGNLFQLAGASPSIGMRGVGSATMSDIGGNIQLTTDLTLNVAGPGYLQFSGAISDDGLGRALTISGANPLRAWSFVTLGGANTFSGGLTLDGGLVATVNGNVTTLGANGATLTVTPSGGSIATGSTFSSTLGTLQLNGDVHFLGNGLTLAGTPTTTETATVVQGSGTLYQNMAAASLTINGNSGSTAASPYTGAVVIDQSALPNMGTATAGTVSLGAVAGQNVVPNGSLNTAASFDVRAGGTLRLDNSVTDSVQNNDRIGNSAPVRLRSGNLTLLGPAAATAHFYLPFEVDEKIGTLSGGGNCTLTVQPVASGFFTTLEADSLVRLERGTFIVRGTALGDGTTPLRARIFLTNPLAPGSLVGGGGAAASQNISILPYAAGGTSISDTGTSLVTYDTDGFRPLAVSEYYSVDLAPADSHANVRLTGPTENNSTTTMNALVVANNWPATPATDASVTGNGTLNITSGQIIVTPRNTTSSTPILISNNIAFGDAEGIIYTPGPAGGVRITGNLTGTRGLTKSGNGGSLQNTNVLALTGDNSGLAGPLTIDAGVVEFNSANALPGDGAIVASGSNISVTGPAAGLAYVGASPLTLSRGLTINTGYLAVKLFDLTGSQPAFGNLTLAGLISGPGSMNYQSQNQGIANAGQIYVTNTGNTYTGATRFAAGITHIAGDGCTGVGGGWSFAPGTSTAPTTLVLEGDVTNSRHINFEGGGAPSATVIIDTNGHNMTLSGPITSLSPGSLAPPFSSTGGFGKNGAGTLTLTNSVNLLPGVITVNAGTLTVNGNFGASPTNAITVASGATLGGTGTIYRNITINDGGTLSPGNGAGTINTGNLALNGTLACEVNGTSAAGMVNVTGTVTLQATSVLNVTVTGAPSGPVMIVRNDGIDSVSGTFTTVNGLPVGATIDYAFSGVDSLGRVGDGNDIALLFPVVQACYPNCDGSTQAPVLNVADFTCFLQKFAAGDPYANCDHSTQAPVLNVADFTCFLQKFAAGCP
jgi:autotransporter-associated beta strand protein